MNSNPEDDFPMRESHDNAQPHIDPTVAAHQPHDQHIYGQVGEPNAYDPTELVDADKQAVTVAWLIITSKESENYGDMVRLRDDEMVIGRRPDCDIVLNDSAISGHHAKIRVEGTAEEPSFTLHDFATKNGVLVNGERKKEAQLKNNDVIRIGRTELTFKCVV
jgi:pSer/pThr/pTyr-binding forkhead associated (FHA) protein